MDGTKNITQLTNQYFVRNDQFNDLFEIRRLIETRAVIWTVERAADSQIDELFHFVKETIILLEQNKLDNSSLSKRDHSFHIKIAKLSNNAIAYRIMNGR